MTGILRTISEDLAKALGHDSPLASGAAEGLQELPEVQLMQVEFLRG